MMRLIPRGLLVLVLVLAGLAVWKRGELGRLRAG